MHVTYLRSRIVTVSHTALKALRTPSIWMSFAGAVLATAALASVDTRAADWVQHRGTSARTAATSDRLPQQLTRAWSLELGAPAPAWPRSGRMTFDHAPAPVLATGIVLVGSTRDDSLRAIDARTGKLRWRWFSSAPIRFAPAVWRDRVFVGSDDGWLYSLRLADGRLLWKIRGGPDGSLVLGNNRVVSQWPVRGGPVVHEDRVYFAAGIWPSDGIFLYALDADSGKVVWKNDRAGALYMGQPHGGAYAESGIAAQGYLVVSGNHLLVPTGRAVPASFRLSDGKFEYFQLQKYGHNGGTPTMAAGGVFFNSGLGFSIQDGKQLTKLGGGALAADEQFIYRTGSGKVTAYQWATSTTKDRRGKPVETRKLTATWSLAVPAGARSLAVAAGECVVGGEDFVAILDPASQRVRWQAKVAGKVSNMAIGDGSLVVSTTDGSLVCFRPPNSDLASRTTPTAPELLPPSRADSETARHLIERAERPAGYVVHLDAGDGMFTLALARESRMHVIAVSRDAATTANLRRIFAAANLLGTRVSVWERNPAATGLPSYCADIVVAGNATDTVAAPVAKEARRLARPNGGVIAIRNREGDDLTTRDRLVGAGEWTHQYADAANSLNSGDRIVAGPLSVAWFRDIDFDVPQRHGRGPAPLYADGRLFHEGLDGVIAVSAYNGVELWRYKLPGVLKAYNGDELMGVAGTGSNMCLGGGRVFIRHESACDVLDAATGKRVARWLTPAGADQSNPPWGYISHRSGILFGSEADPSHIVTYRYINRGGDMSKLYTESKAIFARDVETGKLLWRHAAEHSIRNNAIAVAADRVFIIDRPQALFDRVKKSTDRTHPMGVLRALDSRSGAVLWENGEEIFGTLLLAVPSQDLLVMAYQPTRFRLDSEIGGRLAAFRLSDGTRVWDIKAQYASRPLVRKGVLYAQGGAWDVVSGKPIPFPFKRSYGCGVLAASENLLVFRSATLGYYSFDGDHKTRNYGGMRPGCWINALPVGGMVIVPDATSGCQCSYLNRCWLGLRPFSAAP